MRLTVLGSGGIQSTRERGGAAYLISHQDHHLLLDAGPGALRSLASRGLSAMDLDGACITHRHPDHCCELNLLMQQLRSLNRKNSFFLAGPTILDEYLAFFANWGRDNPQCLPYPIKRLPMPGSYRQTPFVISGAAVQHVKHSLGYRVQCDTRSIVFAGDCGPHQSTVDLARGAQVLLLECSLPLHAVSPAHLNASQAAAIAKEAGVDKLILTHFSPQVDPLQAEALCRQAGLNAQAAFDGLECEV